MNKNSFAGILRFYPLIMWQSVKISVLFHKSTHRTLPFRWKRIFGKFPSFPEKLTLCANFGEKWFCWDFKELPPDYVTINQNFSPIPQIYIASTTILTKKNFWKISQFFKKTYIMCKIGTKMVLLGFWTVTPPPPPPPPIMPQSIKISVLFHPATLQRLPFWWQRISWKFLSFEGKLTLCAKSVQDRSPVPHSVPHSMFQSFTGLFVGFGNFTPIPQIYTQGLKSS